ncbi:hypothetical protein O6H91_15G079600 [Diphasiastrum complanatum]|uniref:Uncharacterized protein n=3 Tax=Diphasiastrum complanatum TaxID=34168 RepID=A0ACC2BK02_DIPCM|nr:hypothetical protein O6H91_15G079600 [Diphasiastrum complanatum]KAJ7530110.1 hypothetical protein O6H91_15G079600 [Diphasiastrum complanatum]KAJ7530112.1 hypothetical protein O6H91_15G079600 [Diphasiastrum complanatum]
MQSTSGVVQAEAILEWLQQEMGYRPPGQYSSSSSSSSERPLPSADSLRKICRGNMLPVWKFLLERVKSEKTVEMIRKNILVHGNGSSPDTYKEDFETLATDNEQTKDREPKNSRESVAREKEVSKPLGKDRKRLDLRSKGRRPMLEAPKGKEAGEKEREREKGIEGTESKERALRERDAAEKEVERLRHAAERLQKDLKGRITDVSREEIERQRVLDDRSNSRHKQVQLEAYDQRCEQAGRIFAEYQRRLHRHVEHAREAQRGKLRPDSPLESSRSYQEQEAVYAVSVKGARSSDDQIFIETSHERSIRKACEVLAVQLINKIRDTFPAYEGGGSQSEVQLEIVKLGLDVDGEGIPEEVKETALALLKSPPQLLRAMAAYTARVVAMISKETDKIDIRADAERLKYKYENDRITEDLSVDTDGNTYVASSKTKASKTSLGLSGRRKNGQLRERQKAHVQQFMATEEALNQAAEAKKISNELIKRLHGGDHGDSTQLSGRDQAEGSLRQFESDVWARERDLVGVKASVSMLNSEVQRLKKLCEERKEAEDALRQKWKRIEEFDARRMELEAVYAALMRANMGAAVSWEQHTVAALEHSAHTIVPVCTTLQGKAAAARDLLEREIAAFQRSSNSRQYMMPATPQALLEAIGASASAGPDAIAAAEKHADAIVARAGAGDPSAIPTIFRTMTTWQFSPGYEGSNAGMAAVVESMKFCLRPGSSAASLMENLFKSISRVQTLKDLVGGARALLETANLSRPDYERSAAACVRMAQEQERIAIRDWLPELKAAVQEAQHCLEDCRRVRGLVDEWWEQPASTAVDWITVDGQTAAAWLAHVKQLQTAFYEKQLR